MSYLVDGESRSLTFNICFEDGKSNEELPAHALFGVKNMIQVKI